MTTINAPGIENLIYAVKYFMKGVSDIIKYFLSMFGFTLGKSGLVALNIILLAFVGYIIWENKPLKYLVIVLIIIALMNIVGMESIFS